MENSSANRLSINWYVVAAAITLLAAIPFIFALSITPTGGMYLGSTLSTDDHMVYAAWMKQAQLGHFFLNNRFTTDAQPSLTVHLYFWALGLLSKLCGIPVASTIGRLIFTFLFTLSLGQLVERFGWSRSRTAFAVLLAIFGGGIGFLVWHNFKGEITLPVGDVLQGIFGGRLPMDVKQPEAFVFPSMLNNGLFMVSMWLIVVLLQSVLDAKHSAAGVWKGALAMAVLMNIHSYDVLLVGCVLGAFLFAQWRLGELSSTWVKRGGIIAAGAILPAIWFVYVLKSDPVFQARAATETYSLNFRSILLGLIPLVGFALFGIWPVEERKRFAWFGLTGGIVLLAVFAGGHDKGYFMTWPVWLLAFCGAVAIVAFLAEPGEDLRNLFIAWAVVGLVAIYIPQLFQRKLGEAIAIPWALLAAQGIYRLIPSVPPNLRQIVAAACALVCGASSLRWLGQDFSLMRANVSTTTLLPAFLDSVQRQALEALAAQPGRKVAIAVPGIASPLSATATDGKAEPLPDQFGTPLISDFNTLASGLTGAYTMCGHWSETPKYLDRRREVTAFYTKNSSAEELRAQLKGLGVTHVFLPMPYPDTFNPAMLQIGREVFTGTSIKLIAVE